VAVNSTTREAHRRGGGADRRPGRPRTGSTSSPSSTAPTSTGHAST